MTIAIVEFVQDAGLYLPVAIDQLCVRAGSFTQKSQASDKAQIYNKVSNGNIRPA